jgi:DNA-binding response OmpR family regulator
MKILIVEDEVQVGEVFRDLLLELGYEPVLVRSAEGALGILQKTRPDAVILDLKLPGMSGIDFLQLRPVRESGVPVVVTSGVATEAEARECLRLGAVDFLDKPVPFERLQAVLASIEPQALFRLQVDSATRAERRRALRVPLPVPVRVLEYNGTAWDTSSVNVSSSGIKIHDVTGINPGAAVKLVFGLPDGGDPIQVMSLLVRQDRDGYAFHFANLTAPGFERLSSLRGDLRTPAFARA